MAPMEADPGLFRMFRHRTPFGLLALALADVAGLGRLAAAAKGAVAPPTEAAVVAYLPEWRYEGANWDTICEHCSHLLLFSLEPDPSGNIVATDRLPRKELMELAQSAARRHGTRLMLCFGGNGRSSGFSRMVRSFQRRAVFISALASLMFEYGFDGVDYNWEYPGYEMGRGYLSEGEIKKDYKGLSKLIRDTKDYFASKGAPKFVSMAYYPDGRQERLIKEYKIDRYADLLHMMSYDQGGEHHSSPEFGRHCVDQGREVLPPRKLTVGLPFYGRHSRTGDWTTYEDLVQRHDPLAPEVDSVAAPAPGKATIGFNGVKTIEEKTRYALDQGLGGVMIWEVGQDCRLVPVEHGDTTHVRTCPSDDSSLLLAISRALAAANRTRSRFVKAAASSKAVPHGGEL